MRCGHWGKRRPSRDVYKYQGAEIHVLLIDEFTHFHAPMYRFLRSRVRMVGLEVPANFKGRFPRILCRANPGKVGHLLVKSSFIGVLGDTVGSVQLPRQASEGNLTRQLAIMPRAQQGFAVIREFVAL